MSRRSGQGCSGAGGLGTPAQWAGGGFLRKPATYAAGVQSGPPAVLPHWTNSTNYCPSVNTMEETKW